MARWLSDHAIVVAAEVAQGVVKLVVEDVEGVEVVRPRATASWRRMIASRPARSWSRARSAVLADRGALERLAHELGVGDGVLADAGHERAELRNDLDEPVVAQALERLADRRAADAEQRRELVLGQLAAGRELGGHDRVAEQGVDLAARAGAPVARGGEKRLHLLEYLHTRGFGKPLFHPIGGEGSSVPHRGLTPGGV